MEFSAVLPTSRAAPVEPHWPLLLKVAKGATSAWGTGCLVQKITPKRPGPIKEKPTSAAECEALLQAKLAEREDGDLLWKAPELYESKNRARDVRELARKTEEDNHLQGQSNWQVGRPAGGGRQLYLITNEHVLRDGTAVTLYFRPRGGQNFNLVTLPLTDAQNNAHWWKPDQGTMPNTDVKFQDVAFLPLVMLEGKPQTFLPSPPGLPPGSDEVCEDPDQVACAGFPLLSDDEHGQWDFRDPCKIQGTVVVRYPSIQQKRVAMPLMWGMSGSLVFSVALSGAIIPVGVFSHIHFTGGSARWDSGIRRVWDWSIVKEALGAQGQKELQIVWLGQ